MSAAVLWLAGGLGGLAVLVLLRRPIRLLLRLLARSSAWLAALVLLEPVSSLAGVTLGVNPLNALLLGALGVPGLGLLLMVQWLFR